MLDGLKMRDDDIIGGRDVLGMFANIPTQKNLEVVKVELRENEKLRGRRHWKPEDLSRLTKSKGFSINLRDSKIPY